MEVSFDLTREDYWRFNCMVYPYQSGLPAFVAGLISFLIMRLYRTSVISSFSISVLLALLAIPCLHFAVRKAVMKTPKAPHGYLERRTVTINADFVQVATATSESRTKWEGIWRVQDDTHYICLFMDTTSAHIIPKRAFASRDDSFRFVTACRQYRKAAVAATQSAS